MNSNLKRTLIVSSLAPAAFVLGAATDSTPAEAHCGEHAWSCGDAVVRYRGGYCEDGYWWQYMTVMAVWCKAAPGPNQPCYPGQCDQACEYYEGWEPVGNC